MDISKSNSDLHHNRLKLIEQKIQALSSQKETVVKKKETDQIADRIMHLESAYQQHTHKIS